MADLTFEPMRISVDTTGTKIAFPFPPSKIEVSNQGTDIIKVYFSQTSFDIDANYIDLEASTGFWDTPDGDVAVPRKIWLRAESTASDPVVITFYPPGR